MIVRTLAAAAVVALLSAPALAGQCPAMIGQIDAALASTPGLSDDVKAEVVALRDKGEQLHNEGKHDESVETLQQAMDMLGQ
ncbi:MAG: hypothetical protein R3285_11320 [Kiloniellales bacterium]|nr:hypothetical protein [Kiloniellales bacterium]